MIERVARAICRTSFDDIDGEALDALVDECWHVWEDAARAAIKAMREPSPHMYSVAAKVVPAHELADGDDMAEAYRAMIDAAVTPPAS